MILITNFHSKNHHGIQRENQVLKSLNWTGLPNKFRVAQSQQLKYMSSSRNASGRMNNIKLSFAFGNTKSVYSDFIYKLGNYSGKD